MPDPGPRDQRDVARRSRRARRCLIALTLVLLSPLALLEGAYRYELRAVPERPPAPVPQFPPLVLHAAALEWLGSPTAQGEPIYPWTVVRALAGLPWMNFRDFRRNSDELLASALLVWSGPRRGNLRRLFALWALTTWISRHLTAEQALSACVATTPWFGSGTHGLIEAADRFVGKPADQLDAEEIARLFTLTRSPSERRSHPDRWRAARDVLLRDLHQHGFIDEATLLAATARPLPAPPLPAPPLPAAAPRRRSPPPLPAAVPGDAP
jgi:hypothetical protein